MRRLLWLVATSALAAVALVALRGQAAASEGPSCASADGFVLSLCLTVPTSSIRRETTVPLVSLPSNSADVRVEVAVPAADALALAAGADRSVERVETLFGRSFAARPRILVFASADSFATGARELFGYSRETAAQVASAYGGIFDRGTATIALNRSAAGTDRMNAAIAHELTHLMIRELSDAKEIPAWLDEGIAALVEQDAAGTSLSADESIVGRAVAAARAITLDQLRTVADFHSAYARLDRPLYAYAAYATRQVGERIGWAGILTTLRATAMGQRFEDAYASLANESIERLSRRIASDATPAIATARTVDGSGNVAWSLFAGAPGADVAVSVTGANGYAITFTVRTDTFGMYRGSFGATAAAGTYTLRAAGTSATIDVAR